jgi:DNA-binding NarL/FixJ family response regulator
MDGSIVSGPLAAAKPVSVAIGGLEPIVLLGLVSALRSDPNLQILGVGLHGPSLHDVIARHAPRVLVVDDKVEDSLLERLASREPPTRVVVVAYRPTRTEGLKMLGAGATCLAQSVSSAEIVAAVHHAAGGGRRFISADGDRIEPQYPTNACLLTPREAEVLTHRSQGASYAQVALAMGITVETVKKHAAGIRRKLGVRSTRELIGTPMPPVVGELGC